MSWTLVQSKGAQSAGSVTTLAVTLTSLPAVGNLIVVAMSNGTSTITSIQDNFFSTPYTQALKETSSRTSATYWFIVPSTPTGSFTVTLTVPSSFPCMAVFEFAGTSGATITCASTSSVSLSYGTTSGGTSPYTNQLQRSLHGAGSWSNIGSTVAGATATFTDSTVSTGVSYDYQVHVTDSASGSQYSSTLNVVVPGTAHAFTT